MISEGQVWQDLHNVRWRVVSVGPRLTLASVQNSKAVLKLKESTLLKNYIRCS